MNVKSAVIFGGALALAATICRASAAIEPIPLDQAVREGKVWVYVTSLGGSTGNTVCVNVKRMVDREVRVTVTPGTIFRPAEADVQGMAAASIQGVFVGGQWQKADVIVLTDDLQHDYMLEAYCVDYDKPAPSFGDEFKLDIRSERLKKVLDIAAQRAATAVDVQVAIWMDRQRAKGVEIAVDELKSRFPAATDQSIAAARRLLVDVRTGVAAGGGAARAGRVLDVPGVGVQVDTQGGKSRVGVDVFGFKVNVNAPAPPRLPRIEPKQPLAIVAAIESREYVLVGAGRPGAGGATRTASADRTFLILDVLIANPTSRVAADQFTVEVGGESIRAATLALRPKVLAPGGTPRLFAHPGPGRLGGMKEARRYKVVFEVPKQATQGKLRWAGNVEVSWSIGQAGGS
jgi:hypothetical protein